MDTLPSARYGGWFPAWFGLVAGLCMLIPTLLRLAREGWTEANSVFLITGIFLATLCIVRLALIVADAQRQ